MTFVTPPHVCVCPLPPPPPWAALFLFSGPSAATFASTGCCHGSIAARPRTSWQRTRGTPSRCEPPIRIPPRVPPCSLATANFTTTRNLTSGRRLCRTRISVHRHASASLFTHPHIRTSQLLRFASLRFAPHRFAPHRTAPHRFASRRAAPHRTRSCVPLSSCCHLSSPVWTACCWWMTRTRRSVVVW